MDLTTPAMLFPAISLLLLAYTNRFLTIAQLIRELYAEYQKKPDEVLLLNQIDNFQKRIDIIRSMQVFGVISFFLCVLSMFLVFAKVVLVGEIVFAISLLMLMISLGLLLQELFISIDALKLLLSNIKTHTK